MPSIFAVARAGAELAARPRMRASSVDEIVIAAVPARPAARPFPTALATLLTGFMPGPPPRPVAGGVSSRPPPPAPGARLAFPRRCGRGPRAAEPLQQVVAHAQRVR